jgi:hypothetical protein
MKSMYTAQIKEWKKPGIALPRTYETHWHKYLRHTAKQKKALETFCKENKIEIRLL